MPAKPARKLHSMKQNSFTRRVSMPMSSAAWRWPPVAKIQFPRLEKCSITPRMIAKPPYQSIEARNWPRSATNSQVGVSAGKGGGKPPESTVAIERAMNSMPSVVTKLGMPKASVIQPLM